LIFGGAIQGFAQEKIITTGLEGLKSVENINKRASEIIDSIDTYYEKVAKSGAYKTLIDGQSLQIPYAILGKGDDKNYAIIVNKVQSGG